MTQSHTPFPLPRLLPLTMLAMALLLVLKSSHLVFAATASPAAASAESPPKKAVPHTPESAPGKAQPSEVPSPIPAAVLIAPAEPAISDSERALLTDLRQRRLALDTREQAVVARERTLSAVEKRLSARVDELTGLQTRLEALEKLRQGHDEQNWRGLVKLYEAMKPRDAAIIFNDLDLPVLLPVLDRMKEAKAAPILSAMQPERARQVTTELAQMRAKANTVSPAPGG